MLLELLLPAWVQVRVRVRVRVPLPLGEPLRVPLPLPLPMSLDWMEKWLAVPPRLIARRLSLRRHRQLSVTRASCSRHPTSAHALNLDQ